MPAVACTLPARHPQFILGNTGFKEGISHQPSNVQLLAHSLDRAARTMQRSSQSLSNLAGLLAGGNGEGAGSGRRSASGSYAGLVRGGSGGQGGSGNQASVLGGRGGSTGPGSSDQSPALSPEACGLPTGDGREANAP